MKKEIKAKWVAALRSGDYKQGCGALKGLDKDTGQFDHCCLGVLCEVAGFRNGPPENADGQNPMYIFYDDLGAPTQSFLTSNMEEKFSFDSSHTTVLIAKNDSRSRRYSNSNEFTHDYSFNDIADYIEQNISEEN